MADSTTVSRLSSLFEGNLTLYPRSYFFCPRQSNVCDDCSSTLSWHFQPVKPRSVAIRSCPTLPKWPGANLKRATQHVVNATNSHSSSRAEGSDLDSPPSSQEEVVQQAGASLFTLLEKALRKQGPTTLKQRKSQRQVRLRVDIPLVEDSPQAVLTLTQDLLDSFLAAGKKIPGKVAVYFSDSSLEDGAVPSPSATYCGLQCSENLPQGVVCALVIAPKFDQAAALESVVRNAGVRPVIVVNPEWSEEEEGSKIWGPFLASFCAAYSFIPLNIQGFFSKTEGAVLRRVRSGAPEAQPWLIYVKEGDNYKCVSRLKKRPTPTDLENALYSSMAANSPVNKSIAFLRGLVSK